MFNTFESLAEKLTRGDKMYQMDYGYMCIETDCQTKFAFPLQMKMVFITVYIKLCMNTENHNQFDKCIVMTGFL